MPPHTTMLRALALTASIALGALACSDDGPDDSSDRVLGAVNVLGIWSDSELASFEAMVVPWESETGAAMEFTGTRDITSTLATRVRGDNPPDVALPAEIGLFEQFAREGRLTPLAECDGLEETVRENYPQSFIDLGTVDGVLYGFFMKADTKATVFYDPVFFEQHSLLPLEASAGFDELLSLADAIRAVGTPPWSNGQEAGAATGFPGSDTIQQIILNDAGAATYDALVDGMLPYTDVAVRDAWEKFGRITLGGATAQGSAPRIIATSFMESALLPFREPPEAGLVHLGGFAAASITQQFPDAIASEDFDVFPWPGGGVTGAANIAYAFNSDPATCSFLTHIASSQAQQIWVERGGFTSLNSAVRLEAYPDAVARAQAEQLLSAETFRFDLDDAIGGAGQQAIFDGVVRYLQDPGSLDSILQSIEAAIVAERGGAE